MNRVHRRAWLFGAAGAAAWLCMPGSALAADLQKALADIAKARGALKTLRAEFEQVRVMGLLASEVKSKGSLDVVLPDKLRWHLEPPDDATYWIGPKGLSFKTKNSQKQTGKHAAGAFGAVLDDLLVMLGGDLSKLDARYTLSVPKRDDKSLTLVAVPKVEAVKKSVKKLTLVAGPELWRMKKITIEEPGGDKSVIKFTRVERDVPIDPAKMSP